MSTEMMEQKLAELERRLAAVEAATLPASAQTEAPGKATPSFERKPKGSWMQLVGWSKDDDLLREAARLGAEWRERMNEEGK